MKKKDIVDAWAQIRKENHSIPDEVLDFMKDAAIEKLEEGDFWYKMGIQLDKLVAENTMAKQK